jgi:hypothetical protein
MMLETADLEKIIDYLLVNPNPSEEETGAILLNICIRLQYLIDQNKRQDTAIDGSMQSIGQLWLQTERGKAYAAKLRTSVRVLR